MLVKYEPWTLNNEFIDAWGLQILEGKWAGVSLSINGIQDGGSGEGNSNQLELDYTVLKTPPGMTTSDVSGEDFDSTLNLIFTDFLGKALNEFENRKSNSTEPGK